MPFPTSYRAIAQASEKRPAARSQQVQSAHGSASDGRSDWIAHGNTAIGDYILPGAAVRKEGSVPPRRPSKPGRRGDMPPDSYAKSNSATGATLSGTRLRTQNRSAPPAQPTHSMNNLIAFCTIEAGNLKTGSGYFPERRIGNHALNLDIPSHTLAPTAAEETTNPPAAVHHSDDELNCEEQHKHN